MEEEAAGGGGQVRTPRGPWAARGGAKEAAAPERGDTRRSRRMRRGHRILLAARKQFRFKDEEGTGRREVPRRFLKRPGSGPAAGPPPPPQRPHAGEAVEVGPLWKPATARRKRSLGLQETGCVAASVRRERPSPGRVSSQRR